MARCKPRAQPMPTVDEVAVLDAQIDPLELELLFIQRKRDQLEREDLRRAPLKLLTIRNKDPFENEDAWQRTSQALFKQTRHAVVKFLELKST